MRHAARSSLEPEPDAADEKAGRERIPGASRIDDVDVLGLMLLPMAVLDDRHATGAVLDDERSGWGLSAECRDLGLAREGDVGRQLLEPGEQPIGAEVGDSSRRREVDATRAPCARAAPAARAAACAIGPSSIA